MTILRKRAALDHIAIADPAVLDLIADRVTDNVRALEGALIRVVAFHSLTQRPIDLALTAEVLDAMYPLSGEQPVRPRSTRSRRSSPPTSGCRSRSSSRQSRQRRSPGRARWPSTSRATSPVPRCQTIGQRLRRAQPRHRPPCLQARLRAPEQRSTCCRRARQPVERSSPRVKPTATVDRLACRPSTATSPLFAEIAHFSTASVPPMTSNSFSEVFIVKISLERDVLLAQLQTVSRVASTRSAIQALSGVQLAATQDGLRAARHRHGRRPARSARGRGRPARARSSSRPGCMLDVVRSLPAAAVTLELRSAEQDVELVSGNATLPHPHAARRRLPSVPGARAPSRRSSFRPTPSWRPR